MAQTWASANVTSCDTRITSANVLRVGMHWRPFATHGAGIGTSAFGW